MPVFRYTALTPTGVTVQGETAALTVEELSAELQRQNLRVQSIRRARQLSGWRRRRVRLDSFLLFNQEFIALLRAGLTVHDAVKLCADRPDEAVLGQTLQRIGEAIRGGDALSEACARYTEVFDPLYLAALRTGEKTGELAAVLQRHQESLKIRAAFAKKVSQALAYPIFLLITLAIILALLFVFVMPRFVSMYADFGADLPGPTRVLVHFVEYLYLYIPVVAGAVLVAWQAWRHWRQGAVARMRIDRLKTRLPLWGTVYRHIGAAQLARTLATLLAGGTPLVEAMRTTAASLPNRFQAERLLQATQGVVEGKGLAESFRATELVPNTALKMIEVGEASGNLDSMLAEIAGYYEERVADQLARAMALVEPFMMLLIGILIGGIILVMYLPIFYMVEIVK